MLAAILEGLATLVVVYLFLKAAARWPGWVLLTAVSADALTSLFEIGTEGVRVGVNLYFSDVAFAIEVLTSIVILTRNRKGIPRDVVPGLVFFLIIGLNLLRGIAAYGLQDAGNSARGELFFIAPALAIMLLPQTSWPEAGRLGRWIAWAGAFLSLVALLRWGHVLPTPSGLEGDTREVSRNLSANYALLVGQGFIAATYFWVVRRRGVIWGASTLGLGVVTVALQHRSVWIAVGTGTAWLMLRSFRRASGRWIKLGTVACVALSVFMVVYPSAFRTIKGLLASDVQEAQGEDSTWTWRVAGYQEATEGLLAMENVDILLGQPAGWESNTAGGTVASIHIHSEYVAVLAGYGVVGCGALLIWLGVFAKRVGSHAWVNRKETEWGQMGSPLIEALFISEVVFFVPYSGSQLQGAMLGLIWVVAMQGQGNKEDYGNQHAAEAW